MLNSARLCLVARFPSFRSLQEKINLATAARVLGTLNAFFSSDSPALCESHVQAPPPELVFLQQQQQQRREEEREQAEQAGIGDGGGGGGGVDGADSSDDSDGSSSSSDEEDSRTGTGAVGPNSSQPGAPSLPPLSATPGGGDDGGAGVGAGAGAGAPQDLLPPSDPGKKKRSRRRAPPVENDKILEWAAMAWAEMQSTAPTGVQGGGGGGGSWGSGNGNWRAATVTLGMTHAGYLKIFQLSRPTLGRTYDVIMLDEAQDSNPCIASIVLRETGCARILVGDSHQARGEGHACRVGYITRQKIGQFSKLDCSTTGRFSVPNRASLKRSRREMSCPNTCGLVLEACSLWSNRALNIDPGGVSFSVRYGREVGGSGFGLTDKNKLG